MEELIKDYKRKINAINDLLEQQNDIIAIKRLETKRGCYRAFIVDLKRTMADADTGDRQLTIPDVRLSLPDIRNKLSPLKNLIAMLENGLMEGTIEVHSYIQKEIEQCKKSIAYLSGNEA